MLDGRRTSPRCGTLPFDLVVTVCDSAAEDCPLWLGQGRRIHLGFLDPAAAAGSEAEILSVFRQVRDQMADQLPGLLESQMGE